MKIDFALMNLIHSQTEGQLTKDRKVGDLSSAEDMEDSGDEEEDKKKKKKKKKTSTKKTKVVEESASRSTPGSAHSATTPGKEKSKESPAEVNGITFICIKFL